MSEQTKTRKPKPKLADVLAACRRNRPHLALLAGMAYAHNQMEQRQRAEVANDTEAQEYQRLLDSHHEASHGYLCWALGVPLYSISIAPDAKGRTKTKMDPAFFVNDKLNDPNVRESVAIVALGGLQGEWIFDNDCPSHTRTRDNEVAYRMLAGTYEQRQTKMDELAATAREILTWQWPTVEALAVELYRKTDMSGADVVEFIERRAGLISE